MYFAVSMERAMVPSAAQWNYEDISRSTITCGWDALRMQLLHEWNLLTAHEIDEAGPDRIRLAQLVQDKYGIPTDSIERYLQNCERTLPLA